MDEWAIGWTRDRMDERAMVCWSDVLDERLIGWMRDGLDERAMVCYSDLLERCAR